MRRRGVALARVGLVALLALAGCTVKTPPATTAPVAWRQPPLAGTERPDVARAYADAWTAIRQGDRNRGARALNALVRATPSFAPGWASLGELALTGRDYGAASASFGRALAAAPAYIPAHLGAVDAALGRRDDRAALAAIDALLAVPEARLDRSTVDEVRSRRAVVALRVVEGALADLGARERAGDLAGARAVATAALAVVPDAVGVLVADARLALRQGDLTSAETGLRRAILLDDRDAAAHSLLADVLERTGRVPEAAATAARAYALDPTPARRDRRDSLAARADAALPGALRELESVRAVTRGQVAGWLASRLSGVLSHVPRRQTVVVTDLGRHWAAAAAQAVLDAGWMTARPNHTFEPDGTLTRADLAVVVAAALPDVMAGREAQLARWRAATPAVPGVPPGHAAAAAIRLAVAAGIMTAEGDQFAPGRLASGADLVAVVARLERAAR